jgi:hypothetical protein
MKPLAPVPGRATSETAAVYADLLRLAGEIAVEEIPGFFAELERAGWTARLRLQAPAALSGSRPLLTVEETARLLGGISEAQVYRMAKGALRSAAINVGEGTLRFDAERMDRFIDARRRG